MEGFIMIKKEDYDGLKSKEFELNQLTKIIEANIAEDWGHHPVIKMKSFKEAIEMFGYDELANFIKEKEKEYGKEVEDE